MANGKIGVGIRCHSRKRSDEPIIKGYQYNTSTFKELVINEIKITPNKIYSSF
jgi:hypothetical protein